MSREIKFRAFDPKNGMIEPYSVRNGKAFIIKRYNKDDPTVTVDGVNFYCNWDIDVATDFPVMQYTGLKDVNGVEIYEGDIVRMWYAPLATAAGFISFDNGGFVFNTDKAAPKKEFIGVCIECGNSFTVIGNIYQHPELLK